MKQKRNYQTAHRIEDTRSQVQYQRHQSLRTLIKTDIYHKEKKCPEQDNLNIEKHLGQDNRN